jgi:SAM-dependent methyltransferase
MFSRPYSYALVTFAERFPHVRGVGLDVEPTSIRLAQELIQARGLGDRLGVRQVDGAAWPADLMGACDVVTTFLVLHEIRPELKAAVLQQCAQALRPGGTVVIFNERYPSSPTELRDPTQIYGVMAQWYKMTWGNVVNTREAIHALLAQQWLAVVEDTSLSRFYIVIAEKP